MGRWPVDPMSECAESSEGSRDKETLWVPFSTHKMVPILLGRRVVLQVCFPHQQQAPGAVLEMQILGLCGEGLALCGFTALLDSEPPHRCEPLSQAVWLLYHSVWLFVLFVWALKLGDP